MEQIFLDVEARKETGRSKVQDLRDAGFIPAVVYGEGSKAESIKVPHRQLVQLLHQHGLENIIINLRSSDSKKARPCLIKELQYHPTTGDIVHIDFNEISLTKAIKVNIPVIAKGESVGVKQEGGSLEHILWEIEIECLPTDIPKGVEVDVTNLKIGDSIHLKDVTLPPGVKVITDMESIILTVSAPIKEEVPAEAIEGEVKQEPEVIKEKKEVPAEGEEEGKEKEKEKEKEKK